MSVVVYGKRLCGQIDRVPGQFYVSTLFFHVQYVPLFPLQSYLVLEGSEKAGDFEGQPIPLSLKSVTIGYLRGVLAAAAFFTSGVAGFATTAFFLGHESLFDFVMALAAIAVLSWAVWIVAASSRWWFVVVQLGFHAISLLVLIAGLAAMQINPALGEERARELSYWPAWMIANAAVFGYSLTRFFTGASRARAARLADELGLAPIAETGVKAQVRPS